MNASTPVARVSKDDFRGKIDRGILEPGWAGTLAPEELKFLQVALSTDKKLASRWGFRRGAKRRAEWAIRQVAELGDPDLRRVNLVLARHRKADSCDRKP